MHLAGLTLGLATLAIASSHPKEDPAVQAVGQKRNVLPLWQAGMSKGSKLYSRQASTEPPYVPDNYAEYSSLCDDYDRQFYHTPYPQNMTFQLQCTSVIAGVSDKLDTATRASFEECIQICADQNVVYSDPEQDVLCAGVQWNAPFQSEGECTTYETIGDITAGSEEGGVLEVAVFLRGPDGVPRATPRPYTPRPTPTTTTIATTTAEASPTPTNTEFLMTVLETVNGLQTVSYVAFDNDVAILVGSTEGAALFHIDPETGNLITNDGKNDTFVYSTTLDGTALLQRSIDPPDSSQYFWTLDEDGLRFQGNVEPSFCAFTDAGPDPDAPIDLYVVYGGTPSEGCNPVTIAAQLDGPVVEPPATTPVTSAAASTSGISMTVSGVVLPPLPPVTSAPFQSTSSVGQPPIPTIDTYTGRPDCPLGVVCPELPIYTGSFSSAQSSMVGDMTTTVLVTTSSIAAAGTSRGPLITVGPNGQTTTFSMTFITTFEIQPAVSCNDAGQCTSTNNVNARVAARTGIRCSPGDCSGDYIAVNTAVDALFAAPTCLIRPTPGL